MTNGTPAACYQKNAREFLAGDVQTSVMAHYAPGLFSTDQHTHSCHPAPDEDASQVLSLVDWREDAPLRLTKIFQIIFALPVEICVRFPYYGSKQR